MGEPDRTAAAEWTALGVLVRLVVTDPRALPSARRLLIAELAAIDRAASRFRPDSEIARIDAADGRPVPVSPLLREAVHVALAAARQTEGDVDPTVGAAMADLGYDRDYAAVAPSGPRLRVVPVPAPGWRAVVVDDDAGTVQVPAGTRLDLGATAKAFVADRAAARIATDLGTGVLVGLGGDLRAIGATPPDGWRVRVQDVTGPVDDLPSGPVTTVALHSGGLATSSTTARRWSRGGDVLHHIVDPRRGLPACSPWRTVTVAAANAVAANTASTASVVRGESAPAWLDRIGLPSRLVRHDGSVLTVGAWPAEPAVAS